MLELVREHGTVVYVLLFAYCALKSGSLPLFAGVAAQAAVLDVVVVAVVVFLGGYLGDEVRFVVARRFGDSWAKARPRIARAIEAATRLMARYGAAYIFLYRYPKGMRTVGALPVGLGDMPWLRFTTLNCLSALLWTGLMVGVGYAFGAHVEQAVEQGWGILSVVLLAVMLLAVWFAWRRVNVLRSGIV